VKRSKQRKSYRGKDRRPKIEEEIQSRINGGRQRETVRGEKYMRRDIE
jgi:hypothetical protein